MRKTQDFKDEATGDVHQYAPPKRAPHPPSPRRRTSEEATASQTYVHACRRPPRRRPRRPPRRRTSEMTAAQA
eukprot:5133486-Prymnesium_polylepis.1